MMKKSFYKYLLLLISFVLTVEVNAQVPYVPTPYVVVEGMLEMAKVTKDDVVYDLGCGDGRIVVTAAKKYGAHGLGVDNNPERIKDSEANAKENNVTDKVEFKEQNLFDTDLSKATVVTLYLLSDVNLKLRPKLFEELKPGTRIVSNTFDMDDWEPDKKTIIDGRNIYFWTIPANASGRWEWNNSEEKYTLDISQEFQKVTGSMQKGDKKYEITNAKIAGDNLEFNVNAKKYSGKIDGDKLVFNNDGSSSEKDIVAKRTPDSQRPIEPTLVNQSDIN